jgi:hypothetical protein
MFQRVSGFQVEPRLFGVFDQEPVAGESAHDTADEAIQQATEAPARPTGCSRGIGNISNESYRFKQRQKGL